MKAYVVEPKKGLNLSCDICKKFSKDKHIELINTDDDKCLGFICANCFNLMNKQIKGVICRRSMKN